jgi:EmrB/QacA subfamily drug resistance transporter
LLVLGICCLSLFIVGLDATIVNLALPAIRSDLNADVSKLQWTIDAYTLVLASLLMVSGSTADRVGRRRTFQLGLVLFGVGSLLCGFATSADMLIAFRMLQAVGGSMLNPVAMSIITNTFTDPRERAQAIGVWGGVVGLSMSVGPVVGGALVDSAGWQYIFWINVPVALAALVLTALFVPESRAAVPRRIDPVGQVLVVLLLGGLTYGIIEGQRAGWGSPLIIGCFVLTVVALIGLVLYERRREEPLLEPRFFRSAPFSGATLIAVAGFAALSGFLFLNSLYLQPGC